MNNEALINLLHHRLPEANKTRCHRWHGPNGVNDWTADKWTVATLGELGETANALKKLWRVRSNMANISEDAARQLSTEGEALAAIAAEFSDTMIHYDLLLQSLPQSFYLMTEYAENFSHKTPEICLLMAGRALCIGGALLVDHVYTFRSAMIQFAIHPEINIDPVEAIINKFNATSIKYGFPERL